jgi:predicted Zn-dependent protease
METDVAAALAEFQTEVRINPKNWPALLVIGSIQIRQGTADQAVASFSAALKIVPVNYRWLCHTDLGRAHLASSHLDAAIAELENAERQMPSSANVHFLLADAYRRAGRKDDADREKGEFEKAKVQQDPLGVPALHPFGSS